jgi:dihydrofolate reductase
MSKLQYQSSMSLDGFIAGPDGDMSWLAPHLGPNPTAHSMMQKTGALLVGDRTFGGQDPYKDTEREGEPYGGGWDGPQFVLTHHVHRTPVPGVTFLDDLDSAVTAAKAAAGDKYVGVLGAEVARQCIEAGVLDEVFVTIAPVLLGAGVRLFHHKGGANIKLKRLSLTETPRVTSLLLSVLR